MTKERMITAIKPSGSSITLGNYIGCISQLLEYQDKYDLYVFIADLHALTVYIKPEELRANTKNLLKTYIAAGLDPTKVCIFKQSDIEEHTQLEWVLTCNTNVAELAKMPQYKKYLELANKNTKALSAGVFLYPSLMNSDILLYDAKYVPIGLDQKPHIDLTRDIAGRFNNIYGETFILPEPIILKEGAKIMSLSDPTKKMSKSESDKGTIYLSDSSEVIIKKFRKATTDSEGKIYYDPINKPGISNLLTILACLKKKSISKLEDYYKDIADYGILKNDVAQAVIELTSYINNNSINLTDDYLEDILAAGKLKAKIDAKAKIKQVYKKIGLN